MRPTCQSWRKISPPLAWTASVTSFHSLDSAQESESPRCRITLALEGNLRGFGDDESACGGALRVVLALSALGTSPGWVERMRVRGAITTR